MAKNIWEAFDTNNDMEGFKEEVKEALAGSGDFKPLPHGKYEVALENLELKPTKETNKPMMVFTFKVEVEEPITEDTEFEQVLINAGSHLHIRLNYSIKQANHKFYGVQEIFARIDGKLQKIWERE